MEFLLALSPILWLIVALSVLHMAGWKACLLALVLALAVALGAFDMTGVHAAEAVLQGAALACWPILLVIIAAIFTYNLTMHTKSMDVIKKMLSSVSSDKRVIILLIGWGFGAFLEGMAGFGTAIAIPAGMLVGFGISPFTAAAVCLVANSVPTAFGSIGIPIVTLANITGMDPAMVAAYSVLELAPLTLFVPLVMILAGCGSKALKGVTALCFAASLGFLLPQLAVAMIAGPELADIAGAICSMGVIVLYSRYFPANDPAYHLELHNDGDAVTARTGVRAWLSFILIFVFLLLTSKFFPFIHDPLAAIRTSVRIYDGPGGTPYTFTWVATPGVLIFLAAFIGGHVQGAKIGEMLQVLKATVVQLRFTIVTILSVIATAEVMGFSNMTETIAAITVAETGAMYPLVAAFIGSVGTFITGSATSSCVLFAKLQTSAAAAIGASEAGQIWIAAANATGACAGKMISPQSIAIAVASIGVSGLDGKLLGFACKVYIPFVIVMGLVVYFGLSVLG